MRLLCDQMISWTMLKSSDRLRQMVALVMAVLSPEGSFRLVIDKSRCWASDIYRRMFIAHISEQTGCYWKALMFQKTAFLEAAQKICGWGYNIVLSSRSTEDSTMNVSCLLFFNATAVLNSSSDKDFHP